MAAAAADARPAASGLPDGATDTHAHVMRKDRPLATQRHSAPARDVGAADYLAELDANGFSRGVLTAPSFYGTDNSLLLEALAQYPQRLRGTAIVAPDISPDALAALDAQGVVGIRLNWVRRDSLPDLAVGGYPKLLAEVAALGWHVEVYLEGRKLASVLPQLRSSGARVVVDHFGSPDPAARLGCAGFREVLAGVRAGDTWVKLSAPYRLGGVDPRAYVDALLSSGPQQLVWASDWPFVSHEVTQSFGGCVKMLLDWLPDPALREQVLVKTPAALFRFGHTDARRRQGGGTP